MAQIDDIIAAERKRLETVLRAAYDAGHSDARENMLRVLAGDVPYPAARVTGAPDDDDRKRAPKGLPRKLVTRVLFENDLFGASPQDVCDAAVTEHEKMIALSSIRSELRRGKEEGRYVEDNGTWTLARDVYDDLASQQVSFDGE